MEFHNLHTYRHRHDDIRKTIEFNHPRGHRHTLHSSKAEVIKMHIDSHWMSIGYLSSFSNDVERSNFARWQLLYNKVCIELTQKISCSREVVTFFSMASDCRFMPFFIRVRWVFTQFSLASLVSDRRSIKLILKSNERSERFEFEKYENTSYVWMIKYITNGFRFVSTLETTN